MNCVQCTTWTSQNPTGVARPGNFFVKKNSFRSRAFCWVLIAVEHFYTNATGKFVRIALQDVLASKKPLSCNSGTLFVAHIRAVTKQSTQDGLSRSLRVSAGYNFFLEMAGFLL
jgi:hypothetical protein